MHCVMYQHIPSRRLRRSLPCNYLHQSLFLIILPHIPRPLRQEAFLSSRHRHPRHPRRPIAQKNQRFTHIRKQPLYTASHRFIHIRFSSNTPAQNPDAPTRLRIEFQLDQGRGHPPRTPMTTVAWNRIDASKSSRFVAKKKLKLPSENFRRRTDRFFPNFFQKTLQENQAAGLPR